MAGVKVEIDGKLAALLDNLNQPLSQAAHELIVLELYRRGSISSGKAGELLGMSRWELIRYASRLGIPFFEMTADEWETEKAEAASL